jgi:hypothetical protein
MGLSDWERNQKVTYAVHKITELSKGLKNEYSSENYEYLKSLCQKLWHRHWGKDKNSSFWFLGTDTSLRSDGEGLWSLAVYDKVAVTEDNDRDTALGILEDYLQMGNILAYISDRDEIVYRIWEWAHQIQYAANRENDDVSERHSDLMELVSSIMGECFSIFRESDNYAIAEVLRKISELLYKNTYLSNKSKWDAVTKYLVEDAAHHEIRKNHNLDEIKGYWKSLYLDHSEKNRLYVFLQLSKEHYKHKWDEIFALAKKKKWDEKPFKELMGKNMAAQSKKEKDSLTDSKKEDDFYTKEILGIKGN